MLRRFARVSLLRPVTPSLSLSLSPSVSHANSNNNYERGPFSGYWSRLAASVPLLALFMFSEYQDKKSRSCGIVGVVGSDDASKFLLEGLMVLRNRGYDSAGVATIDEKGTQLEITKFASRASTSDSIELLSANTAHHKGHFTGIGHTRWATHGGKTDYNAHPHTDSKGRIAVVHNGTINNSYELRKALADKGIKFVSETDTEVIAQLIGVYMDEGLDTKDAVKSALQRCEGTWGLAIVNKSSPREIVVACNGSPMMIGIGPNRTYIASETSAFSNYTKNFIAMKDGEIGVVSDGESTLDMGRVEVAAESDVLLTPAPYPHFTIKECVEQPLSIARALGHGARMNGQQIVLGGLDMNKQLLSTTRNVLLTGCGTSKFASEFGAKLMRDLNCFDTVFTIDSAEVRRSDIPRNDGLMMAISQSGETKDVHRAVKVAMEAGMPCLSVVNTVGSLIARTTGMGVYLNAGREHAVASTKAFSSQVTVLALIALWFRAQREETEGLNESRLKTELLDALKRLPISFGMSLRSRNQCKSIAEELVNKRHLFILGKGYSEPIAHEGALKIKELCYLHAEGFSGGALKHGPFALIEGNDGADGATPLIAIILDDDHAGLMRTAAEEVKARGGKVYVITDNPTLAEGIDPNPVIIPSNGPLTALIAVLPLQLIAYELSILKGIDPDVPRNLAKAVTVD
mmetsp:Transcript_3710/g.5741  ORF Transcript_3710/g.5741 Transcript_3710/m.5741 type:complete len:688 (-) Transcript_3710:188-2251(-)|eukprot:CAMPEP_0185018426 /NCGR_PEP_ID=MMETSP1103-20130426/1155_1 /TAXON_ID=36769 /ORGANISM="Paraphysomonas bandaiensis, Strain Caron Lab Isolate" /LENGTH=687 /DNA_ID=CAMNT_0027548237 /DNA_START=67 /DNA_END=2130 /DNA_ORIENTATION=+